MLDYLELALKACRGTTVLNRQRNNWPQLKALSRELRRESHGTKVDIVVVYISLSWHENKYKKRILDRLWNNSSQKNQKAPLAMQVSSSLKLSLSLCLKTFILTTGKRRAVTEKGKISLILNYKASQSNQRWLSIALSSR